VQICENPLSMVILRDSVQFIPARGSDTQLLIALTLVRRRA
jgi:hypothetical protein